MHSVTHMTTLFWVPMDRLAPTLDSLHKLWAPTSFMSFHTSNRAPLISPQICGNLLWIRIPSLPQLLFLFLLVVYSLLPFFYFSETWQPWIKALLSPTSSEFHVDWTSRLFYKYPATSLSSASGPSIETDVSAIHYVLQGDETATLLFPKDYF